MKKLILAVAVVLVVALLGLPPVLGRVTQLQVEARAAALTATGAWSIEVASYDRGWFHSHAKIQLSLKPEYLSRMAAQTRQPFPFELLDRHVLVAVDLAHGPVAALDGVYFGLSKMVARLDPDTPGLRDFLSELGIPYLFEFRGRTSFTGALAFDADMPAIDRPVNGATFNFSGATLAGSYADSRLKANGGIDSVRFGSPSGGLTLENLRVSMDNVIYATYLAPGRMSFSLEHLAVVQGPGAGTPALEAANLKIDGDTILLPGSRVMTVQITYGLDALTAADMRFADAALTMGVSNIDVEAFRTYLQTAQGLSADGSNAAATLATLDPVVDSALRAGPIFTIEPLRFRLDGEPLEAHVELAVDATKVPPAGSIDLEDPALWFTILHGHANIDLSKKLAQRLAVLAAQMRGATDDSLSPEEQRETAEAQAGIGLVMLVGQGVLVEDGDGYTTKLELTDGKLTLNGQLLPFGLP